MHAAVGDRLCAITFDISAHERNYPTSGIWRVYVHGIDHQGGPTLDEAMRKALEAMSPEVRAADMRKKAAELLAEAKELAP